MGSASVLSQPAVSVAAPGLPIRAKTCPLNRDDVEARLRSLSEGLAELPRTGTAVITYT